MPFFALIFKFFKSVFKSFLIYFLHLTKRKLIIRNTIRRLSETTATYTLHPNRNRSERFLIEPYFYIW